MCVTATAQPCACFNRAPATYAEGAACTATSLLMLVLIVSARCATVCTCAALAGDERAGDVWVRSQSGRVSCLFVSSRRRHTRLQGDWSSYVFFFSSRRRHTRLQGDWSSDVCSSDLDWTPNQVRLLRHQIDCFRARRRLVLHLSQTVKLIPRIQKLLIVALADQLIQLRFRQPFLSQIAKLQFDSVPLQETSRFAARCSRRLMQEPDFCARRHLTLLPGWFALFEKCADPFVRVLHPHEVVEIYVLNLIELVLEAVGVHPPQCASRQAKDLRTNPAQLVEEFFHACREFPVSNQSRYQAKPVRLAGRYRSSCENQIHRRPHADKSRQRHHRHRRKAAQLDFRLREFCRLCRHNKIAERSQLHAAAKAVPVHGGDRHAFCAGN